MSVAEKGLLERNKDTMTLNMGPQHPSTHGVFRVVLEMDGELVQTAHPDIGFLHTGIEKTGEDKLYAHCIPMTDRLDYLNPPGNAKHILFHLRSVSLYKLRSVRAPTGYPNP